MANNNTKAKRRLDRKAKKHFHGSACDTGHGSPTNNRRSKHDYGTVRSRSGGAA